MADIQALLRKVGYRLRAETIPLRASLPARDAARFVVHVLDLGEAARHGAVRTGALCAYEPIVAGMRVGFEADGRAAARVGRDADGAEAIFLDIEPGRSRWLTLEASVDASTLRQAAVSGVTMFAASVPRLAGRARIGRSQRAMWRNQGSRRDANFIIDANLRNIDFTPYSAPTLLPAALEPNARLILELAPRRVSLCLRKIVFWGWPTDRTGSRQ